MRLDNLGYKVTKPVRVRRQALGRAVQRYGYKRVYRAVSQRKRRADKRYREERLRADRNWLKNKMRDAGVRV